MLNKSQRTSAKLIDAVTAPLGFFVLALLIVESFLAAALLGGVVAVENQLTVIFLGVSLFIVVTVIVAFLVWKKPENLTFDKQAHLDRSRTVYGTDSLTVFPAKSDRKNEP